jgi:hypothetical protein
MNFKKYLNTQKKLAIFDFDGTLAKVPEKPKNWAGKDWWGNEDSLSSPYYNNEINQNVFDIFIEKRKDPETKTIVLTGRRGVIAHSVRNVLINNKTPGNRVIPSSNTKEINNQKLLQLKNKDHNISGDHDEYFSGDHNFEEDYPKTDKNKPDGSTIAHKEYVVRKVMNNNIQVIEYWDDREDHIEPFIQLTQKLLNLYPNLQYGIMHKVISNDTENATIIDIPIKRK